MYKVAWQVFWDIREAESYQRMLRVTTGKHYPIERI
jgi:hypothetical protein